MRRPWMIVRQAWRETELLAGDRDCLRVWIEAVREAQNDAGFFGIMTTLESVRDGIREANQAE